MINDASVVIGGGNWGIKEADVLGYKLINEEYYARDIDFANSTAAGTYTDSTGLIRKAPYNLLQQSNTFSNASWQVVGTPTLTANYDTNPLTGANDAWRFQSATASDRIFQSFIGSFHNFSLYAKGTGTIRLRDSLGAYVLDMVLTSSWQRASVYIAASFTNVQITSNGGCDATIYAAQLVQGTEALDYFPTTDRLNVPRIDYRNADGSLSTVGRLLLEPQRTNSVLYSDQFDNAYWTKLDVTVNANTTETLSPDGTNDADKIVTSAGTNSMRVRRITITISSPTISIYAKAAGVRYLGLSFGGTPNTTTTYDLLDGVITQAPTAVGSSASIQSVGNGWYRCILSSSSVTNFNFECNLFTSPTGNAVSTTIVGNGTDGVYLFGAQSESGAFVSSYIPTTTATVTRNADVASKTGVSSWIGQTQGTIFAEIDVKKLLGIQSRYILNISDNTANNRVYIAFSGASSNVLRARIFTGGVQQASIDTGTISSLGTYKLAFAYNNNDAVLYVNGVQIGTDTSVTVPACSKLNVCTNQAGANPFDDGINQAAIFTTRLTNSQLQSLTTI